MNGALFRGRIFCRLYLNASLEFPSLCSVQCHMPKQTTRAVSDFLLQRLLSYCIMTANHSQPLQQQMQHGKLSAWIFADNDSSANQLSVPINRQNRLIGLPLILHTPFLLPCGLPTPPQRLRRHSRDSISSESSSRTTCKRNCPLPSLEVLFSSRCLSRATNILKDPSHPGHQLFDRLLSGRHFRSVTSRTNGLNNSFYPRAIRELNTAKQSTQTLGLS